MTARFLATAVMCVALGVRADGQELASDLSQLRVLVKVGDSLTVTDTGGQRAQGRLVQLDASAIVLELPNKQRRQFDGAMVDTVEKRSGDSLKNGALIGLISGGALGIWAGISDANYYEENFGSSYSGPSAAREALGLGLFMGGVGAAIGTGIDALIHGRRVIYAKSKTTVSVAPVSGHDRKGVMFTLWR